MKTQSEIDALALKLAADYAAEKKMLQGLTSKQHGGMLLRAVEELGWQPAPFRAKADKEEEAAYVAAEAADLASKRLELFAVLLALENGSALRQKLEKAGKLTKSEAGAVDAASFL